MRGGSHGRVSPRRLPRGRGLPGADAVGTPPSPPIVRQARVFVALRSVAFFPRTECGEGEEAGGGRAGIRREQRRAERERLRERVLSGALGCYPLSRAVFASEGRVLTDLNRNARLIDGDAAGIRPGDVVVSSMMEDAGFLAPLDEDEDEDDQARRVDDDLNGSDDDDDRNDTAGDAPRRPGRRRGRRSGRAPAPRYTHEPRVYFVLRGRVDVLAPGPGPAKDPTSDGEDEKNEMNEKETGRKKRREGRDAKVRHGVWHRAVGLGPGACFSAPLQAMHGAAVPGRRSSGRGR